MESVERSQPGHDYVVDCGMGKIKGESLLWLASRQTTLWPQSDPLLIGQIPDLVHACPHMVLECFLHVGLSVVEQTRTSSDELVLSWKSSICSPVETLHQLQGVCYE